MQREADMEINITRFVENCDAYDYSGSVAERGDNAGPDTWNNALTEAKASPLLVTDEQLDALREHVEGFGAWSREEIDTWSPDECNAMFIQLIGGDIREAGLDADFLDEFDWDQYEERQAAGTVSINLYRGSDNQIYYYLGD
jgi:hypothetical protein